MNELKIPSFDEISEVLQKLNALTGAAETHGFLCGMLCVPRAMDNSKKWLEPMLGVSRLDRALLDEDLHALIDVFEISAAQLEDLEFGFEMLLPNDEQPLLERAQALREWCQGFLAGLSMVGVKVNNLGSEDAIGAIEHIDGMATTIVDNLVQSEDNERDYYKVQEHIRISVLVIYSDLAVRRGMATDKQLH